MMVLQSCVQDVSGSQSETCVASSHVDSEVVCVKVEDVIDMKVEEDTLQVAEYEVSCESQGFGRECILHLQNY
jgi:hypothetical protein